MDIKCWGSRGSISVSGSGYLKYGGDTTCVEITAKSGQSIIVDAGTGIRRLGNSFLQRNIKDCFLLFTHGHWDHILGFAFFRPLQHSDMTITIQDRMVESLSTQQILDHLMKEPLFPITLNDLKATIRFDKGLNGSFSIGSVDITTIPVSHPSGGLGYKFTEEGKSFVFLTDNELGYFHPGAASISEYIAFCKNADLLFHDGEYTEQEYPRRQLWGHSSISDVLDLAAQADVKRLGLFHLNQDRTDDQMDQLVGNCRAQLKKQGLAMDCFGVDCDFEIKL